MSAREAVDSFRAAVQALDDGDTAQVLLKGGETVINVIGAVPGGDAVIRLGKAGVKRAAKLLDALKARRATKDTGTRSTLPKNPTTPDAKPDPAKQSGVKLPRKSVTKNPLTPEDFNKLPNEDLVDPNTLRTA